MLQLKCVLMDGSTLFDAKTSLGRLLAVLVIGGLMGGCAATSSTEPLDEPADPTLSEPSVTARQQAAFDADGNPYAPGSGDLLNRTFYFAYDQYDLKAGDLASLKLHARMLVEHPDRKITIEGHADERGTRDYNLALGERRAESVRMFLVSAGVSAGQIETVSYGEERPEDVGRNDAAWSRNRRALMSYHHGRASNDLALQ